MNIQTTNEDLLAKAAGKKFRTILVDPPWRFINRTGKVAPEHLRLNRYETLSTEQICGLPIANMAQETAHLYLWVPNALLPDGLRVMQAWGFTYKSNIVWHKIRRDGGSDGRGVGFYFRNVTELLLFGTRGKNARTEAPGRSQVNFMASRKREHSRKPDEQYELIESCSKGPYLELFARAPVRAGSIGGMKRIKLINPLGKLTRTTRPLLKDKMPTLEEWRPGSFTKNFSWGSPRDGLKQLHESIRLGFAGEMVDVPRDLFRERVSKSERPDYIPINFFLFNKIINGQDHIVADELVYQALNFEHSSDFDRLGLFAFIFSYVGRWKGAEPYQARPALWAHHYVVDRVANQFGWDAARVTANDIERFVESDSR